MRRILILTGMLLLSRAAHAQWIVNDPQNTYHGILSVEQLKNTVSSLKEQRDRLDESLDFMRKVNSVIADCETVKSIISRQVSLSDKCISLISGSKLSSSTLQTLSSSMETIMSNNARLLRLSRTILSTGVKMNDAERLASLQNIERQTLEEERKISKISRIISQYERLKRALR